MAASGASSLYPNLRLDLPDPHIPWAISPETFEKMADPTEDVPYKATQLFPTDPEWAFVWHHFHHDKPTKYSLGKVLIVHERHQQQAFEQSLFAQEKEATKFLPTWNQEPRADQRTDVIARWKEVTALFSPFESMERDGRRRIWKLTKVLPLFHGTRKEVCHSICESGHTFFGKTSLTKNPGDPHSTDDGYFGSGIYFTNSAKYAADIYSQGHLLISWVSMREPFPFVGDPGQQDMNKLRGKGAYKQYNAHYIPVSSFDPTDPNCPEYYPSRVGQIPDYDEYVVFNGSQTLPRFWIHLIVDGLFLKTIGSQPEHVEDLIPHVMTLLQNSDVDSDKKLRKYLNEQLTLLLQQEPEEYLDELGLEALFSQLQLIVDRKGRINRAAVKALTGSSSISLHSQGGPAHLAESFSKKHSIKGRQDLAEEVHKPSPALKVVAKAAASPIPSCAFGANEWEQYFGLKVVEPQLPPNIEEILASRCSIFSGKLFSQKTVEQTHFLTLIPEGITLEYLEELMLNPKEGYKNGFRDKEEETSKQAWAQHHRTATGKAHWVLMTKELIPYSCGKSWKEQEPMIRKFKEKGYELLSGIDAVICIAAEYVKTGNRFYPNKPWTYSRCMEKVKIDGLHSAPLIVGGFSPLGISYGGGQYGHMNAGLGFCRKFF